MCVTWGGGVDQARIVDTLGLFHMRTESYRVFQGNPSLKIVCDSASSGVVGCGTEDADRSISRHNMADMKTI